MSGAAAAFDRAATMAAYAQSARRRKGSRAESLGHDERIRVLGLLAEHYRTHGWSFREPRPIAPQERVVRRQARSEIVDLRWPSDYQTLIPEIAARYDKGASNRLAAVRMLRHREPRPVAILVHGYLGGQYPVEERAWPTQWIHRRLGMDVALFTLPYHGARANPGRFGTPPFPGSDPRITNDGFRQAMADMRDLVAWLSKRGHPSVGVMGMSLGGYSTALCATLEPTLAFAVPVIPLTSLADFARDQGRLGSNAAEKMLEHEALDRVHRMVSPLHRTCAIDRERVLVIGAEADRITPLSHARNLAQHFDARLETWHGGHLLQFGRSDAFRSVGRFLDGLGVTRR
jgi:pimeloyl-ACP methyl ester carboxylesterase